MTSLCRHLSAPEIVNWVTTADGCVHTDDTTKLCQLVANSCTHRRRDETRQFRLVGVGSVYWALVVSKEPSQIGCGPWQPQSLDFLLRTEAHHSAHYHYFGKIAFSSEILKVCVTLFFVNASLTCIFRNFY